jgi:hypothetical protein
MGKRRQPGAPITSLPLSRGRGSKVPPGLDQGVPLRRLFQVAWAEDHGEVTSCTATERLAEAEVSLAA